MWAASQPLQRMLLNALLFWIKAWQPSLFPKQEKKMGTLAPRRISVLSLAGEGQRPVALAFVLLFLWVYWFRLQTLFFLFFIMKVKSNLLSELCLFWFWKKKPVPPGHRDSGHVCLENVLEKHGFRAVPRWIWIKALPLTNLRGLGQLNLPFWAMFSPLLEYNWVKNNPSHKVCFSPKD